MTKTVKKIRDWIERHTNVRYFLIAVLLILCAFELQAIMGDVHSTYQQRQQYLSMYHHGQIVHQAAPVPTDIQSWMTFAYIDFVFHLPPTYLQNTLHLSDPHYPNVQIRRYAKTNKLDANQLTASVQQAVAAYGH